MEFSILSDGSCFGKHCKYIEDYRCRFSDKQLYNLVDTFLKNLTKINDANLVKPNILIAFLAIFGLVFQLNTVGNAPDGLYQFHSTT